MFEFLGKVIMFVPNLIIGLISGIWHIVISIVSFPINLVLGILKFLLTPFIAIFLFFSPGDVNNTSSATQPIQVINSRNSNTVYVSNIEDEVTDALRQSAYVEKKGSKIIASMDEDIITPDIYAENIVDGVCDYFNEDYARLKKIKEIEILNQYSYQGYVFENPGTSCAKINDSYSELWGYTHIEPIWYLIERKSFE